MSRLPAMWNLFYTLRAPWSCCRVTAKEGDARSVTGSEFRCAGRGTDTSKRQTRPVPLNPLSQIHPRCPASQTSSQDPWDRDEPLRRARWACAVCGCEGDGAPCGRSPVETAGPAVGRALHLVSPRTPVRLDCRAPARRSRGARSLTAPAGAQRGLEEGEEEEKR